MTRGGFLNDEELQQLTGRRMKSRQIEWLRTQGLPFRINATGHPVVTWAAVDGQKTAEEPKQAPSWTPRVLSEGNAEHAPTLVRKGR